MYNIIQKNYRFNLERNININGTLIWYYFICKREVWLIAHSIEADQENEFIALGYHIHEIFYQRKKKEIFIDNTIKIDILPDDTLIGEIKKSSKSLNSAKMQLAFYLYYLKHIKGVIKKGVLLIPEEKRKIEIELTPDLELEIEKAIKEILGIIKLDLPPKPIKTDHCKSCGYKELCWS
jgi:CRISPR-associated exonuclease Cas4